VTLEQFIRVWTQQYLGQEGGGRSLEGGRKITATISQDDGICRLALLPVDNDPSTGRVYVVHGNTVWEEEK
jgi:hypothetical protein